MTRFTKFSIAAASILAALTITACESDEHSPTAPVPAVRAPITAAAPGGTFGDEVEQTFSWTGSDGHQYSVRATASSSRHFQDGVEYADVSGDQVMVLDGGAIISDQLLGAASALPMASHGLLEHRPGPRGNQPQRQMISSCAAEIVSYLEASAVLVLAAATFNRSRTAKARAALIVAIGTWSASWRALYACEAGS